MKVALRVKKVGQHCTRRTSWKTSWKPGVATSLCVHGTSWKLVRATVMTKKPDLIHNPTLFMSRWLTTKKLQ